MRILRLSWKQIDEACRIVSSRILASNFKPDLCVAISRGGFIPARLMCDLLGISNLACIKIEYYSGMNVKLPIPVIAYHLSANAKGKRILLADDVADSGNTLMVARKHMQEAGAKETRVATLHYKPWSKIRPDYYSRELRTWIVYPWEVSETIRNMFSDLLREGKDISDAKKQLSRIGFAEKEVRMALSSKSISVSHSGGQRS
ncbi:MAG: phosphoribosyltransferase [Promethearchaeati archaeon SRVP18_Atabeyarchaeia-1]